MPIEVVSNVEITDNGDLLLRLESGGHPSYQYVYRAGAGVYWDQGRKSFKFSTQNDGFYTKWFVHMLNVAESEMGLQLCLGKDVTWTNVPDEIRDEVLRTAILKVVRHRRTSGARINTALKLYLGEKK